MIYRHDDVISNARLAKVPQTVLMAQLQNLHALADWFMALLNKMQRKAEQTAKCQNVREQH